MDAIPTMRSIFLLLLWVVAPAVRARCDSATVTATSPSAWRSTRGDAAGFEGRVRRTGATLCSSRAARASPKPPWPPAKRPAKRPARNASTRRSGTLSSSSYMSASLEAGDACTFRVQPASEASIETLVLVFTDLYVFSGEMYVYEGAQQQQQNLRWTCLGCGDVLPPPFYFDRGAAFISFRAPQDQVARFAFSYLAHTDDMRVDTGAAYRVDLLMAQALLRAPRTAAGAAPRALAYRDRAETLPSGPALLGPSRKRHQHAQRGQN